MCISFGGYKNYNGEYKIPYWWDQFELLKFVDPNFIRDNLDNNLVQEYLKTALDIRYQDKHENYLKKIVEYSKDFHGNLKSEKDYLLKLVEIGLIEYIDTKFICDNIDDKIIQDGLSAIKSVDRQKDLFNYFHDLYNNKNKSEEIEAIDKKIGTLMKHCDNIICNLDEDLIVNDLNKSYIRDNICKINYEMKEKQKKICNNLYNQYQNTAVEQNEQQQMIIENVLFIIQAKNWKSCINYFDDDFIIDLLFGKNTDIVTNMFKYIGEEKACELCSKLCKRYENSTDDEKVKCKEYIIKLVENVKHNDLDYHNVASYLSGKFVLDHLEDNIIKKKKLRLIPKTCQDLCSKYSESQGEQKNIIKTNIINLLKIGCLDAQDLSIEFIVECVFEDKWLKKIDRFDDEKNKIGELVGYLCDKYKNNEINKSDCTTKIFQLITVHEKAICYLSVEFIAENFDTDIIKNNLNNIDVKEKQKELYNYFYDKYNEAKKNQNGDLENINKNRIITLMNKCKKFIVNANVDTKFIFDNRNDMRNQLSALNKQYVIDKLKTYLKGEYFLNQDNEPDFEKQEKNKDEVLNWIKKLNNLINVLHPKFIAENLQNKQILDCIQNINAENLNLLYDYICENYNGEEQKSKILVLIDKFTSKDFFSPKRFLYDNFNEETVQEYISQHVEYEEDRRELWEMLYGCYLNDKNETEGKSKLLRFIETCNKKIEYWHWCEDGINTQFVCNCLEEKIIKDGLLNSLILYIGCGYCKAKDKMTEIFKYLCEAQKEYESENTGKDRTTDILNLIDKFKQGIQYVNIEFIYKNFNASEVKNALYHITESQGKQLVDYIKKNSKEDDIEQYFLTLVNKSVIFKDYIDMKWIYKHLDNTIIKDRLSLICKRENIEKLYDCIVTSEKKDEQKKQDILMIADSHKDKDSGEYKDKTTLINFLCVIDARFILDNLDDSKDGRMKKIVRFCLGRNNSNDFDGKQYLDLAQKFALRKLICAIELVQDKSEQEKLYLKLLSTLNYSTNVFRYTSIEFLEDRVDSENEAIKKYITKNISVKTYKYKYGENAATIEKSGDIETNDEFVKCLFDDISQNNRRGFKIYKSL